MPPIPAVRTSIRARLRAIGANPSLRRLEAASLLWNAGEQVYLVGLLVYAYLVGGTAAVALAPAA